MNSADLSLIKNPRSECEIIYDIINSPWWPYRRTNKGFESRTIDEREKIITRAIELGLVVTDELVEKTFSRGS